MGFQQGLSGLNAASQQLDVIGNNISNANTVGFKQAVTQFADVYANSLSGASTNSVGIGVQVAGIAQQFTQGNISSSNNPLDIAINGNGFFRMSNNGAITYTRNGQFSLDKNGYIINTTGSRLTGYTANSNGVLATGSASPLNINTSDLAPQQTSTVNAIMNLNSTDLVPGTQTPVATPPVITPTTFNPTIPSTYNETTSVTVYDSLGNSHVVQTYYVRIDPATTPPATAGNTEWNVFATVDGNLFDNTGALTAAAAAPVPIGKLAFNNMGVLQGANPAFSATNPNALKMIVPVSSGALTPINSTADIKFDFTSSTQFGSPFSVSTMKQDGFTSGKLSKFSAGKDGTIIGSYTNGQTKVLGQIVLAGFTNPNGLQSLGGNQWGESSASGQALVAAPTNGSLGALTSSATEDSNTDLTGQLVQMITAQRNYQANAQTIKTQDQIMQTLVNLR